MIEGKDCIILFERYESVRYVLEKAIKSINQDFSILSSASQAEVKDWITHRKAEVLITELSLVDTVGLSLSAFARQRQPDIEILWISVASCQKFSDFFDLLDITMCLEKPLGVDEFEKKLQDVLIE